MKKFLLFTFAVVFAFGAVAQKAPISKSLRNLKATRVMRATDNPVFLSNAPSPYVVANPVKSVSEAQIGTTLYDLQSNQSVANRIHLHADGTIGATWTGALISSYSDRGTYYNYFDGTAWGTEPTARIEAARSGWPSYFAVGATGEGAIAHNGTTGLLVTTRATKGTGAWATTTLVGPTTTGSTTALLWPRSISDGNTIHVIACTDQATAPAVYYYDGLALALVYYKSTDGGATWSAPQILPGMDSASVCHQFNNAGFSGDAYAWAAPKGDTIAFVVGDNWGDMFAMRSYDAGATWTKVMIYDFPALTTAPTPIIGTTDGSVAIAIDDLGKVHVLAGHMRVSDDDFADVDGLSSYYPYTDGLIYWNESMPQIDTATMASDSALDVNGYLVGYMEDFDETGAIEFPEVADGEWPFGNYFLGLSSMPQIHIDNAGDIYITYSACREDLINTGATPNAQIYRHIFAKKSLDGGATWSDATDLNGSPFHAFDECVFASLSYTSNSSLHLVYQCDMEPGLAVRGDEDGASTNSIYYLSVPKSDVGATDINVQENESISNVMIYPNPASAVANIDLNLASASNVNIDVYNMIGQSVYAKDFSNLASGDHHFTINTSSYKSGIYFISINAGDYKVTRKLIVE